MSTKIMADIWPLQMSPTDKAVLISLADNANDEGVCWPSISTISNRTCLSERTVIRSIKSLCDAGFLSCNDRSGRSNMYIVASVTPVTESPHPCHRVTPPLSQSHPTPDTVSPRTIKNHKGTQKEPKNKHQTIPDGFCISDRVRDWASKKGYSALDSHFEYFVGYAIARGAKYADWDQALMNAIRGNWAKVETNKPRAGPSIADKTAQNMQRWLDGDF